MTPVAFTRNRRLPLPCLIAFLLNAPRAGLQPELELFFDEALGCDGKAAPTKSALCQARRQLRPQALRELLSHSARVFAQHCQVELWQGRRVLALDGTTLRVPGVPECAAHFGGMQTACGKFRPLARATALLDVARGCFVDAQLGGYAQDERSLAPHHLPHLGAADLVVMDRGFPSREWLGKLVAQQVAFCVRMGRSWEEVKRFARGELDDKVVDLGTGATSLPVRLLLVVLPNGSILILATNVLDPTLGPANFAALYRGRWEVAEALKLIKARRRSKIGAGSCPTASNRISMPRSCGPTARPCSPWPFALKRARSIPHPRMPRAGASSSMRSELRCDSHHAQCQWNSWSGTNRDHSP